MNDLKIRKKWIYAIRLSVVVTHFPFRLHLPTYPYIGAPKLAAMQTSWTAVFTLLMNVGFNLAVTYVASKYLVIVRCQEQEKVMFNVNWLLRLGMNENSLAVVSWCNEWQILQLSTKYRAKWPLHTTKSAIDCSMWAKWPTNQPIVCQPLDPKMSPICLPVISNS